MTRPLLLTAAFGFLVSIVCFTVVFATGGSWRSWDAPWSDGWFDDDAGPAVGGPTITRELTWMGGEELHIMVPATVSYTQGAERRVAVTGPKGAVDRVILEGETLRFDRRGRWARNAGQIQVVMTAPDVREFTLAGSQRLSIAGFDQDRLEVHVLGSGDVIGTGRARRVEVQIAGSGDVDLGGIATDDAEVHIAGSGEATLAPKLTAEVHIAGSGDVVLTTRPTKVETHIAGSGRIVQGEAVAPSSGPGKS